nr:hypothetical protein [Streptosporangium canum]
MPATVPSRQHQAEHDQHRDLEDHHQPLGDPGRDVVVGQVDPGHPHDVRQDHQDQHAQGGQAQQPHRPGIGARGVPPGQYQARHRHRQEGYERRIPVDAPGHRQRHPRLVGGEGADQQHAQAPDPDQQCRPAVRAAPGQRGPEGRRAHGEGRERDGQQPAVRLERVLADHGVHRIEARGHMQPEHCHSSDADRRVAAQDHPGSRKNLTCHGSTMATGRFPQYRK